MPLIVLDPGHGQYGNQYPADKRFYEGTQMYKLGAFLTDELKAYGFTVLDTRQRLVDDPPLASRGAMAAEAQADLFLSLHSNAIGSSGTTATRGIEIYYSMKDNWNISFADGLGKTIASAMNSPFRFAVSKGMPTNPNRDYFQVVRSAAEGGCRRAMLIEHGYHTNPEDTAFLTKDDNLKALAVAEAAYIAVQFGLKKPEAPAEKGTEMKIDPNLKPFNTADTKLIMVTACASMLEETAFRTRGRLLPLVPTAGIRPVSGGGKFQIVLGRYDGTLSEAKAYAAEFEQLTGIPTEAWAW